MRLISENNYKRCQAIIDNKVGKKVLYKGSAFTIQKAILRPTSAGMFSGNLGYHEVGVTKKNGDVIQITLDVYVKLEVLK